MDQSASLLRNGNLADCPTFGEIFMDDVKALFEPLQVKNKILRNRIVMPPMVVNRGVITPESCEWYSRRAKGGVGMVIVESTSVIRFGLDYNAENLRPLVDVIHDGGALAVIQLYPGMIGQPDIPVEMTIEQIEQMVSQYRIASEVCAEAGFDGVEPHGAHGYLLNQFFSPIQNKRTDKYGDTLEGFMRLALDIVKTIQEIADKKDMLILYRHTPIGAGYDIEESLILAEELVKAGLDILDVSPASDSAPADNAAPFMKFGIPIIAVNEMDNVDRACEALHEKRASLIAVGRGLIADPDWANKVLEGRMDEIVECTRCNECFRRSKQRDSCWLYSMVK